MAFLTLIPAYREAKRNGWLPDFEAAQPFPGSGSVTVSRSVNPRKATAHLRVVTAKANAVVQLYDDDTNRHVISVYVARGDDVTVPIPTGTFRMRLVAGPLLRFVDDVRHGGRADDVQSAHDPLDRPPPPAGRQPADQG